MQRRLCWFGRVILRWTTSAHYSKHYSWNPTTIGNPSGKKQLSLKMTFSKNCFIKNQTSPIFRLHLRIKLPSIHQFSMTYTFPQFLNQPTNTCSPCRIPRHFQVLQASGPPSHCWCGITITEIVPEKAHLSNWHAWALTREYTML